MNKRMREEDEIAEERQSKKARVDLHLASDLLPIEMVLHILEYLEYNLVLADANVNKIRKQLTRQLFGFFVQDKYRKIHLLFPNIFVDKLNKKEQALFLLAFPKVGVRDNSLATNSVIGF